MLQSFAGGRLFGSRTGAGTLSVLALHGWARTHRDFDATLRPGGGDGVATAATVLDALAVDLPGFGASPAPPDAWGSAEYAECVSGLLDEVGGPVVVVGHSFGGRVAAHLAQRHPDQVRALVLAGVPLLRTTAPRQPALGYRVVRGLRRAGVVSSQRLDRARERYGSADYRAAQGIMRPVLSRVVAETYGEQLDAARCPVTLVWGDDDSTVPLGVAEAALARLRAGTVTAERDLVVCPGAGHLLPLTAPGELRQAIERHLA